MSGDMGTLHEDGERWMLRFERTLAHPVATVWRMVTDPDGLAAWFPARVSYDRLAVGVDMTFRFTDEDLERADEAGVQDIPKESRGQILELDPERVFAFSWMTERLRFELTPEGDGCRLLFTHVFDRDTFMAPRNATGWHVCLDHLEAAVDGGQPPGEERPAELMPHYQAVVDQVSG